MSAPLSTSELAERLAGHSFAPAPCYASSLVTLYHSDCLAVLPIPCDAVVTDPPYPDYLAAEYGYKDGLLEPLRVMQCKQIIFWSAKVDFPLDYSAIHIWDKWRGAASQYERIFERNGGASWAVFRRQRLNNEMDAILNRDELTDHPSQKPIRLIKELLCKFTKPGQTVCDPFMGSGTTGVACLQTGRKFIGVERDDHHFATAIERIKREESQGRLL